MTTAHRARAWVAVGVAATSLVMLIDVSRLLGDIQSEGHLSYSARVFTGFKLFFWHTAELVDAMNFWRDTPSTPTFNVRSLLSWHLGADALLFVPAYCFLIWLVLRRIGAPPAFARKIAVTLWLVDWAETGSTYYVLVVRKLSTDHSCLLLLLVQTLTFLKWLLVAAAVVVAIVKLITIGVGPVLDAFREARAGYGQHPAIALFGLIVLIALFAALVALPAGGALDQLPDVLRDQLSPETPCIVRALSVFALLLLAGTVVAAGLASTYPTDIDAGNGILSNRRVVGGAGLLSISLYFFARLLHGNPGMVPFAPLIVVLLIAVAACVARCAEVAAHTVPPESPPAATLDDETRLLWVGALAGAVVVAGGLGLVRAAFPPIVLGIEGPGRWWSAALIGALTAIFGGFFTQWLVAMAWLGPITIAPVVIVPIAAWLLVVPSHGAYWTTTGVVAIGFAFLALVIGLLKWISRRYPPWDATDSLGFGRRTPWLALLGVTWVVASILNTDGVYHDARVSTDLGPSAPRYTDLKSAFDTWLGAQDQCAGAAGQVPMVLVAASGGGIRAAYWTAVTLDALFGSQRGKCPALRLFAVSGVSGGSVGATAWVAAMAAGKRGTGVVKEMSKDHGLAAAAAGLLLRDLIQPFTGITTWRDRAALLEDGWTESVGGIFDPAKSPLKWSAVGNGHGLAWVPLLVLNASSVTDGCRVLVANVGALPAATGGDCGASPLGQRPAGPVSASIDPFPGLHERTDTNAAKWNSLGTGMRAVTAALLSARFPIISPSGALLRWVPDTPSSKGGNQVANKSQVITYDVDGGYYENSGLLTLLQIWAAIDPLVREHNQSTRANDHPISPWIVVVDNHYRSNAKAAQPRRPLELVAPLSALSNNRILGQTALEQTAALAVRAEGDRVSPGPKTTGGMVVIAPTMEPSVAAPLGWVLSETSRSDMNNQFKARHLLNESPGASGLRELLRQLDSWGNS